MATADSFILQEDGFHLILEDGSGDLLLEVVTIFPDGGGSGKSGRVSQVPRLGRISTGNRLGRASFGARSGRVRA